MGIIRPPYRGTAAGGEGLKNTVGGGRKSPRRPCKHREGASGREKLVTIISPILSTGHYRKDNPPSVFRARGPLLPTARGDG